MKYNKSILGIVVAALMAACTEDISNILGNNREIAFELASDSPMRTAAPLLEKEPQKLTTAQGDTFYLHTEVTSRGNVVATDSATMRGAQKTASDLQSDGFVVSAYNTADGTTRGLSYFEFLNTTYNDSKFTPQNAGTKKYWPSGKLMFYAYYPKGSEANGITQGTNASTLTYAVPSTPANHPDLMTAVATNQQYTSGGTGTTPLTFNHALCAVKFQTGTDIAGGTINSITFNNVYTSGTYNLDSQTWSDTSTGDISFTGLSKTTTEGTTGTAIMTDDNTLMLIPQDFTSDDQKIIINFTDENGEHIMQYVLNGSAWTAGVCVVYNITTEDLVDYEYTLETTSGNGTVYSGGTVSCGITSYRTLKATSEKQNVAWTILGYSTDGGNTWDAEKPNWLTISATSGAGSTSPASVNATMAASPVRTTENALKEATPIGSSSEYFDLSMHNVRGDATLQNTANCYVVNAPGYYKFPAVYGNAIKNGEINASAYHTTNTGSNILTNFVNHSNSAIYTPSATDPYINKRYTPDNAVVVWQDVNGMMANSDVKYNSENGYVQFYIAAGKIAQGNCVIALRQGTTVLWSWHIWVTPKDIANTIPVTAYNTSYTYNMASIDLGWCATTNTSSYAARYVLVKVRQAKSGKTAVLKISQYSESGISTTGNAPYYQGGRKDPMLPGLDADQTDKPYWGNYTWARGGLGTTATVGTSIQNPHVMYLKSDDTWCSTNWYNLWDISQSTAPSVSETSVKTVYDPCPPGFKVPPILAFTGFTTTGDNSTTASQFCVSGSFSNGWYFYTNSSRNNTIFFPAKGARDCYSPRASTTGQGKTAWVGSYISTRTAHSAGNGNRSGVYYILFASASYIYPKYITQSCGYGAQIRPVTE